MEGGTSLLFHTTKSDDIEKVFVARSCSQSHLHFPFVREAQELHVVRIYDDQLSRDS
jgi:hypothetical protein